MDEDGYHVSRDQALPGSEAGGSQLSATNDYWLLRWNNSTHE